MTQRPPNTPPPAPQPDPDPAVRYIDLWEQNLSLIATRGHPDTPPDPDAT